MHLPPVERPPGLLLKRHAARPKHVDTLLTIAQLGYAHWFFGNVYEAVVRVPDRLSNAYESGGEDGRLASLLSPGSPVRYYLPGIPVVTGATLSAVVAGWATRRDRSWLGAIGLTTLAGIGATVYLVAAVNRRLFVAGQPLTPAERDRLLRIWHAVNLARLLTAGAAWLMAARFVARLRSGAGD
jgi:hypothetical protein